MNMLTPVNLLNSLVPKLEVYQVFRSLTTTLDFTGINLFLDCVNNGLFLGGGGVGSKGDQWQNQEVKGENSAFLLLQKGIFYPHTLYSSCLT